MAIEPVFGNIRVSGKIEIPAETVKAECKTEIPTDTVIKVLDVNAFCGGVSSNDQPLKLSGTVIFTAVFNAVGGKVKKCECAQEFSCELNGDVEGKTFIPSVSVVKTSADTSGSRLTLSAIIKVGGTAYEYKDVQLLTGGDGIITDGEEKTVYKSSGIKQSNFPVEEEFAFPYEIAEVLSQQANAVVKEVQSGVGAIIVDGEVYASALLLQNSENGDIIKEEKVLPFRFEIECDDAMPKNVATAGVSVKSIRSDVSVDPETGKSTANVLILLSAYGECFAEETVETVSDAFSVNEQTELAFSQAEFVVPTAVKTVKRAVSGRCPTGIPAGASVVAVTNENAEITSLKTDKAVNVAGVYSVKVFFKDADGKTGSVVMETPFEFNDEKADSSETVEVKLSANGGRVRPITENESEISGDVIVTEKRYKTQKVKFASSIVSCGEKPACKSAVSVYIPLEGESMFSLSKRLNVLPDELAETNKELTFPLTGKERIVVYRQK